MYSRYFIIFSPWKKALHLINLNSEFSLSKHALCQLWLKLVHWFCIFYSVNVFSLFRCYLQHVKTLYFLHLEKGVFLSVNKFDSPSFNDVLQGLVDFGPIVLRRR